MQIPISIVRLVFPVIVAYMYIRNRSVSVREKKWLFVKSTLWPGGCRGTKIENICKRKGYMRNFIWNSMTNYQSNILLFENYVYVDV